MISRSRRAKRSVIRSVFIAPECRNPGMQFTFTLHLLLFECCTAKSPWSFLWENLSITGERRGSVSYFPSWPLIIVELAWTPHESQISSALAAVLFCCSKMYRRTYEWSIFFDRFQSKHNIPKRGTLMMITSGAILLMEQNVQIEKEALPKSSVAMEEKHQPWVEGRDLFPKFVPVLCPCKTDMNNLWRPSSQCYAYRNM